MFRFINVLLFLLLLSHLGNAQVLPKEGSQLNYRLIGFKFPAKAKCSYRIEIAAGTHLKADSFEKKIVVRQPAAGIKQICEVPYFGKEYTWRVVYTDAAGKASATNLYHFSTASYKGVDTTLNRLRIIDKASKYKDAYVFIEANRALYDMEGNPVWFLPKIEDVNIEYTMPVDLQLSPQGTVTFMYENIAAYEIDYNGKILFKTPKEGKVSGDTSEHCHHEFYKLKNGHYMVMGTEIGNWDKGFAASEDSTSLYFPKDKRVLHANTASQQVAFGTLIEYDKKGKRVWSWRSSDYLKGSDIYFHKRHGNTDISTHANSFYFDEQKKEIYVGFQDISRIIKVKYPEGKVQKVYGEIYHRLEPEMGNGVFCHQTSCKLSKSGNLYLYNNNSCDFTSFPTVVMISPTTGEDGSLKKVWEYTCPIEGETGKTQTKYQFTFGGNVVELPDNSIFTSMSTLYSRVLIVSPEKQLLWSAIPERWNKDTRKWELVFQYKASLINSRKDMERFIWSQEGQ